jgi:hypothetical protein
MGNLRGFRISYAGKGCRRKIVRREKAAPIVNWIKLNFQPAELSRIHFLGTDGTAEQAAEKLTNAGSTVEERRFSAA